LYPAIVKTGLRSIDVGRVPTTTGPDGPPGPGTTGRFACRERAERPCRPTALERDHHVNGLATVASSGQSERDMGGLSEMKRRTLDLIISGGGLVLAFVLLALGLVLQNQSDFAKGYVATQLGAQQITMPAADALGGADQQPGGQCLVTYGQGDAAARLMTTGAQAECYANQYIAYHMAGSATEAGFPGATYATLGGITRGIQGKIDEATTAGTDTTQLQAQLTTANELRDTMFKGETLRGLLLTTYGFSVFAERLTQAALLAFLAAAVLLVLSIAGFVHAVRTSKDEVILTNFNTQPNPTA
jgi:hypothetical protein